MSREEVVILLYDYAALYGIDPAGSMTRAQLAAVLMDLSAK